LTNWPGGVIPVVMPLLALLLALSALPAAAGDWAIVNDYTLKFTGHIKRGEYERFSKVFTPLIREIHLDSGGGLTVEGLKIANAMADQKVKVVVVGLCMSSCANYLFVAGHEREIRGGAVGFHGSQAGCSDNKEGRTEYVEDYKKRGLGEEKIAANMESFEREIADEYKFMDKVGVSRELHIRACRDDKGLPGKGFTEFLLPKPETFEKYGIHGVVGTHNTKVLLVYDAIMFGRFYVID